MVQTGQAEITENEIVLSQEWSGQSYVISWHNASSCDNAVQNDQLTITLTGFQDTAGNSLSGNTVFTYGITTSPPQLL